MAPSPSPPDPAPDYGASVTNEIDGQVEEAGPRLPATPRFRTDNRYRGWRSKNRGFRNSGLASEQPDLMMDFFFAISIFFPGMQRQH